jgi:hypothetical protein
VATNGTERSLRSRSVDQLVVEPVMIPLPMIVQRELVERIPPMI